jgi:lysophospholipase L1-like esterase
MSTRSPPSTPTMQVMTGKDATVTYPSPSVRASLALLLAILLVPLAWPAASHAGPAYPSSMAALGDSITRAYNAGERPFADAPDRSWATGGDEEVASLYSRLVRRNPSLRGRRLNLARSGTRLADVRSQAARLQGQGVEYVTVLSGANDLCAPTEREMTPVACFRADAAQALAAVHAAAPRARVSLVSIPDVVHLLALGERSRAARTVWLGLRLCASVLDRAGSDSAADAARRRRVARRLADYNAELEAACAPLAWCTWDGGAVFRFRFEPGHVSSRDFFHPSRTGQAALASVAWRAAFPRAGPLTPTPP